MKFGPFIATTIAIGLAVGWLAPSGPDKRPAPAAPAAQPDAASAQLAALQREQWLSGEVMLPRASDGHFYADVTIDGGSTRMMVDTGASIVALTADDAAATGVQWSEHAIQPVARGANGTVFGVPVVLERVQVGQLEAERVEAVVIPEGLDVSLLGQSFLSKIQRVEIQPDRMVLGG
jgi:aspartyl protease family protein